MFDSATSVGNIVTLTIQREDRSVLFSSQRVYKMTVAQTNKRWSRQCLIDLMVASVSVPLLVLFGLMLERNMRDDDWTSDPDTRWHVLGLGLALLFISLLVCGYVTHRLGICIWAAAQDEDTSRRGSSGQRLSDSSSRSSTDSQLHLVLSRELPPSYESVVSFDMPPPYCSVLVFDGKPLPVLMPQQAKGLSTQAIG